MLAGVQETCIHTLFSKVPCGDRTRITSTLMFLLHPTLPEADRSATQQKGVGSSLASRSQETDWRKHGG